MIQKASVKNKTSANRKRVRREEEQKRGMPYALLFVPALRKAVKSGCGSVGLALNSG